MKRCAAVLAGLLAAAQLAQAFDMAIVCDAGSTGTRLYVYSLARKETIVTAIEGPKVKPGLSSFGGNPEGVPAYIAPLVAKAKTLVPLELHATTPFFVMATAGMRLIPHEQQEAIFDQMYRSFRMDEFPFLVQRSNLAVIDGETEGFYGLLAANHLLHRIRPTLHPMHAALVGALDLGGSSTQVAFPIPGRTTQFKALSPEDSYVHSYLGFGAELAREKVMAYAAQRPPGADGKVGCGCFFTGFEIPVKVGDSGSGQTVTVTGTGDSKSCTADIEAAVLSLPEFRKEADAMPSIDGVQFLAMSMYFYAIDCMKVMGASLTPPAAALISPVMEAWPTPSLAEIGSAAEPWCATTWEHLQTLPKHPQTPPEKLPHRCFDVSYMAALLGEKGLGASGGRDITFALSVEGVDVEWTIGAFLDEQARAQIEANGGSGQQGGSWLFWFGLMSCLCLFCLRAVGIASVADCVELLQKIAEGRLFDTAADRAMPIGGHLATYGHTRP